MVLRGSILSMGCSGCDWDPEKELESQRKHGITFEIACCVFGDPDREEVEDEGNYGEERCSPLAE